MIGECVTVRAQLHFLHFFVAGTHSSIQSNTCVSILTRPDPANPPPGA
ncbi:hypothetical protein RSAG8_04313, partial [Rhizoctonia solani AG-8 WAC10335]